MNNLSSTSSQEKPSQEVSNLSSSKGMVQIISRAILAIIILVGGGALSYYIYISNPPKKPKILPPLIPLVETIKAEPRQEPIVLYAIGTIETPTRLRIYPQVSGTVEWIHPLFEPGNILPAHATILKVEATDYEIIRNQREAEIRRLKSQLEIEKINAEVAQQEWDTTGHQLVNSLKRGPGPLLLRKPQIESLQSQIEIAEESARKANLDLMRTQIQIPFPARVLSRSVGIGSLVGPQVLIGEVIEAYRYWVIFTLPRSDLMWIKSFDSNPSDRSRVRIFSKLSPTTPLTGVISSILPEVETQSMMVQIRAEFQVEDSFPVLLGEVVNVEVEGKILEHQIVLPKKALRGEDRVWVVKEGKLDIRHVKILWQDREKVVIEDGVFPGEEIIISDLPFPIPNMPVQTGKIGSSSTSPSKKKE